MEQEVCRKNPSPALYFGGGTNLTSCDFLLQRLLQMFSRVSAAAPQTLIIRIKSYYYSRQPTDRTESISTRCFASSLDWPPPPGARRGFVGLLEAVRNPPL